MIERRRRKKKEEKKGSGFKEVEETFYMLELRRFDGMDRRRMKDRERVTKIRAPTKKEEEEEEEEKNARRVDS